MYQGYANIKPQASAERIRSFVDKLKSLDCYVHVDDAQQRIDLELTESKASWAVTGEITALFLIYNDVVNPMQYLEIDPLEAMLADAPLALEA